VRERDRTYLEAEKENADFKREDSSVDIVSQEKEVRPAHRSQQFKTMC